MADEEQHPKLGLGTGRIEAFSDGVFAIAITLLVLDLTVPAGSGDDLLERFLDQWPSFLAYIVSFAIVGAAWLTHSVMTQYLARIDSTFARINLLLLLVVSLLPFPTRLLAEYIRDEEAVRVAVTILGLNYLMIVLIMWALWRYARGRDLVRPDADEREVAELTSRLTPGLAGYVVFIVIGLFVPIVAVIGFLVVALMLLVPIGGD